MLKKLSAVAALAFALAVPSLAMAGDVTDMYDGKTGVNCRAFNDAAHLWWDNQGGDWQDMNGVAQGSAAWSVANVKPNQTGVVELDVTGIGRSIFIRFAGSPVKYNSRENIAGRPLLVITKEDDSTQSFEPLADSAMMPAPNGKCSSITSVGNTLFLEQGGGVLEFPVLPAHKAAKLVLTINRVYGAGGSVSTFRMVKPFKPLPPKTTGYAADYPDDVGICNDPRSLYCETWDRPLGAPPVDWWEKTNSAHVKNQPSKWNHAPQGVPIPDQWMSSANLTGVPLPMNQWLPDCGLDGSGCFNVHYRAGVYPGNATPNYSFTRNNGESPKTAFFRYYMKYAETFTMSNPCDGGKRPGWGADNEFGGNGGSPATGYNGWSTRGHYAMICDQSNPVYPRLPMGIYVYHAEQTDLYGDDLPLTGTGDLGLVKPGEWNCFEGEMTINDPGVKNGVIRSWINGHLVQEKTDLYFRGPRPAQGYGNWQIPNNADTKWQWDAYGYPKITDPVTGKEVYFRGGTTTNPTGTVKGNLGIEMFWGTAFQGGKYPFSPKGGKDTDQYYDNVVVSLERIGCKAPKPPVCRVVEKTVFETICE